MIAASHPPHLDLQMTSEEYQLLLKQYQTKPDFFDKSSPSVFSSSKKSIDPVLRAIEIGNRNLEWLKVINKSRLKRKLPPISFSSASSASGYPMTQPRSYGPKIIEDRLTETLYKMPPSYRAIIDSNVVLPEEPNIPLNDYLKWSNDLDVIYQLSTRWLLLINWKDHFTRQKQRDIRGFYFLSQEKDLEKKLKNFSGLSMADKKRLRGHLIMLCQNTEGVMNDPCEGAFDIIVTQNKVYEFYQQYKGAAQSIWQEFFEIQNPRQDLTWDSKNPNKIFVPFVDPKDKIVENFLTANLHDEWKFLSWQLVLNFSSSASIYVRFEPDAMPNVDSIGGNRITMNKNTPLTEYDVQWTIRHEFGHTLGFADCYLEFYVPSENAMTSYQIDIHNLMCSRKGKIQQTHYDQMKKYYFRP